MSFEHYQKRGRLLGRSDNKSEMSVWSFASGVREALSKNSSKVAHRYGVLNEDEEKKLVEIMRGFDVHVIRLDPKLPSLPEYIFVGPKMTVLC